MTGPATTRLSPRGEVVIPPAIRRRLRLSPGAEFLVVGSGDVVLLKKLPLPTWNEFYSLAKDARRRAARIGLRPAAVRKAIQKVRTRSGRLESAHLARS